MTLSKYANLDAAIIEINRLEREISNLKNKNRNVTGRRLAPTNADDTLQGDLVGDYLYVLPNLKYTLDKIDGYDTLKWIETSINIGF